MIDNLTAMRQRLELAVIRDLFDPELDRKRVARIDKARETGATWQQIAEAMGYTDRRSAEGWHRRHK